MRNPHPIAAEAENDLAESLAQLCRSVVVLAIRLEQLESNLHAIADGASAAPRAPPPTADTRPNGKKR